MRVVLQRVARAAVTVGGERVAAIDRGLLLLVGIGDGDPEAEVERLAEKVANLRVFADEAGKMNLALADVGGEVLVVSQFTLYGDARKGRRPTWNAAAGAETAEPLVDHLVATLRGRGAHVETGRFGADMQVALVNDGPVTLILDM